MKLELFQFLIEGLVQGPNKFSNGFQKTSECGIISTDHKSALSKPQIRSSCDFISSANVNAIEIIHPIIKSIYYNCQHIRSKIAQEHLYPIEKEIRNKWACDNKMELKSTIHYIKKIYKQDLVDFGILKKYYIRVVSVRSKTIIIGDLHGSMHTLLRHLYRFSVMGFLDLLTLEFQTDIKLIFLGDCVDRGIGSLEVLMIIFTLMSINPTKVFYNKGNHETREMNEKYGFKDELIERGIEDLFEPINELFDLFSCAIVLKMKKNNKNIWLCHGGFEVKYISQYQFDFTDAFIPFEPSPYIIGTLWHDFKEDEDESKRGTHIVNLNRYDLTEFLDNNNLDFIIRGHQDKYNNSYLFGPDYNPSTGNILSGFGLNYLKQNNIEGKKTIVSFNDSKIRVDGPIAIIKPSKENFKKSKNGFYYAKVSNEVDIYNREMIVFPCLVISTNTDYLRDLVCDSFVILS